MDGATEKLKSITTTLLLPGLNYSAVRDACASLSHFFYTLSGFDINAEENQRHIYTNAGLAVSPYAAAFCIMDFMRTRNFLQGIKEAIDTKLKENPGNSVTVLYAGTGPFATLLTPLTLIYEPSQLQLVLMDINPISINYLQKIIQQLNMHPYIIDVLQADALTYLIPDKHQPDLLVSETMKPGLQKEPQVSIMAQLLPQCKPGTIVIPWRIKIEACLLGNITNVPNAIISLQTLLELETETILKIKNCPADVPILGSGIEVIMNELPPAPYNRLGLTTAITVFNNHRICFNESSLTVRHVLMHISDIEKFPSRLLFRYKLENEPGFIITQL